ncbi:P-loop containing nucleoside triphosphate hydrolase protein [Kalaharituber pfeilii]|nr:P-loop containing nucleoside triphosphate hydrolase protein [Kalaharituber pfeilii]
MPARAPSPAGSEFELDISSALADAPFQSDHSDDEFGLNSVSFDGPRVVKKPKAADLNTENIFGDAEDGSDDEEAEFIAAQQLAKNRKGHAVKGAKKGGGFQSMGLNHTLLKAIARKGFSVPTPIQRKTIPLLLEGLDVVGMARTGSGKTAAFVIPMIEKLKTHSAKIGARALILSPSRELALQTLKVVKEFARGTDLKCVLLVGGDSLEDQFGFMAGNPDIIIATPGRFLHLQVEMELDLRSIQYVVFDEADRLFEMGFSAQLSEILHALPTTRQTLLFSATLPKSLVEFAKAGLQEPSLIRLDADHKISQELESAFFSVKSSEKEGALLHILQDVIKVPKEQDNTKDDTEAPDPDSKAKNRKKSPKLTSGGTELSSVSTIIFAATKHHVEYLSHLISMCGYPVSFVYGSLDQVARRNQVNNFRSGLTKILVVTDVAARGIDIPIISNVINYDFPPQPKVFVHRVGRTARAGKRGWAYSLVRAEDLPYLLDLQLFLGRKLVFAEEGVKKPRLDYDFAGDVILGGLVRDSMEHYCEQVNRLLVEDTDLASTHNVAMKGEKLYMKTKVPASAESVKRAKEVVAKKSWTLVHPLFADQINYLEDERAKMLARVSNFRPHETIFEIGQRGLNKNEAAEVMRRRREKIQTGKKRKRTSDDDELDVDSDDSDNAAGDIHDYNSDSASDSDSEAEDGASVPANMAAATEEDLASTFRKPKSKKPGKSLDPESFQDSSHFMSYLPSGTSLAEDRAYSVNVPSFSEAARTATFDLTNDDGPQKAFGEPSKAKGMRWDKKSKKYVQAFNDEDGSRGKRMIIGESGQKIAASFRSGRFEKWKQENRITRLPRVGEAEDSKVARFVSGGPGGLGRPMGGKRGGRMFHSETKAPKPADRYRDDYDKRKKRVEEAKEKGVVKEKGPGAPGGRDLKNKDQIRKEVKLKARRKEKSNRLSRKKKDERRPFRPKAKAGGMRKGKK